MNVQTGSRWHATVINGFRRLIVTSCDTAMSTVSTLSYSCTEYLIYTALKRRYRPNVMQAFESKSEMDLKTTYSYWFIKFENKVIMLKLNQPF